MGRIKYLIIIFIIIVSCFGCSTYSKKEESTYVIIDSDKNGKILISNIKEGSFNYKTIKGKVFKGNLSNADLRKILKMFDGKSLYRNQEPSCGFGKESSIEVDGGKHVFYLAQDSCDIIYYKNKKGYFEIGDSNKSKMRTILRKYGFKFSGDKDYYN